MQLKALRLFQALTGRSASRLAESTMSTIESVQAFLDGLQKEPQDNLIPRFTAAKTHLLRRSGKLVRPLIVWLLGKSLGIGDEQLKPYAVSVELIHVASLLHDDVIDRADTRRHAPSANALYDNTLPVLAGDALLAEVQDSLARLGDIEAIRCVAATIQDLVAGEAWQYELQGKAHDDIQSCVEVSTLKTGALLSFCTWVPAHLAKLPEEKRQSFAAVGRYTGISFQLVDDLIDFFGEQSGKPQLGDWQEGKTNAMTAALLQVHPEAKPILADLFTSKERPSGEACLALLEKTFPKPAIEAATAKVKQLAEEYAVLAQRHCEAVPDNETGKLFRQLQKTLLERTV